METSPAYTTPPTSEEAAFEQFALLTDRKRALEDELAQIKRELTPLGEYLLAVFESHPGKGAHSTQGYTIYQAHEVWARSGPNKRATIDALLNLGYEFDKAVSINALFLSGLVREYKKDGKELPDDLAKTIMVDEKVVVRARKA